MEITDEQLVAYLDGALPAAEAAMVREALSIDPDLAERANALGFDVAGLRAGMEAVLAAAPDMPIARSEKIIPMPAPKPRGTWPILRMAAAAAAVFALGLGAGWSLRPAEAPDWQQAVADYQMLYTGRTVTGVAQSAEQRAAGLALVADALGADLTLQSIAVDGLRFQRAQLLEWNGKPLGQLVYLDAQDRPIAFCLLRADASAQATIAPAQATLSGMEAVTWRAAAFDYIVIGPVDANTIQGAADQLGQQLNG